MYVVWYCQSSSCTPTNQTAKIYDLYFRFNFPLYYLNVLYYFTFSDLDKHATMLLHSYSVFRQPIALGWVQLHPKHVHGMFQKIQKKWSHLD